MVAGIVFSIVALILCGIGLDILSFNMPDSPRPGMSGSWHGNKLWWTDALCLVTGFIYGLNAWKIFRPSPSHRATTDQWSPWATLLWSAAALSALLVYYPLPYFGHHIDRFLLVLGLVFVWGAWLYVQPTVLGRMLDSRPYQWLRVGAVNVALFLILGEAVMRLGDPILARSGLFSATAGTPGGGIPHQAVCGSDRGTNSLGFRDRERTLSRTSAAPRLVAFGDSFTWGTGVTYEDMFITLVERGLAGLEPGAEVVNLGLVGYQPEEYLALLKAHGLAYQPDLVLVNFYIGNDFLPTQGMQIIVAGQRHRVHINGNWFHDHLSWDHWYLSHNLQHAVLMGTAWVGQLQGEEVPGKCQEAPRGDRAQASPIPFSGWTSSYLNIIEGTGDLFLRRDTPQFLERWHETTTVLGNLDDLLDQRGIPWTLVLLPDEVQVEAALQRVYLARRKGDPEEYDFEKPQRLLGGWGKERGVQVIDLLPHFRAEGGGRRLYFNSDIHWNREGHALAASAILRKLGKVTSRPK